jgi:hypothetical protein
MHGPVKLRFFFAISLGLNLILATVLSVLSRKQIHPDVVSSAAASAEDESPSKSTPATAPSTPVVASVATPFDWSSIESSDYRQYIANLRRAGCPDRTIRDIIVFDIDQLYAKRESVPARFPPWKNGDRRRAEERDRAGKLCALRAEKRALVKELIGYEWDNHANEVWHEDIMAGLVLGFLQEGKAPQLLSIVEKYSDLSEGVKQAANGILIDEDHVQLQKLYNDLVREVSQLLNPMEREELELRVQAAQFLPANDIHWDGVSISGAQLREFVRISKKYQDVYKDEFLGQQILEDAQARNNPAFQKEIEKLLGPVLFANYLRTQDPSFREICGFVQDQKLPSTAAVEIHQARQSAEDQAGQLKTDTSLSREEKAAALTALKTATAKTISSMLGKAYPDYLEGPGHWLELLAPQEEDGPTLSNR